MPPGHSLDVVQLPLGQIPPPYRPMGAQPADEVTMLDESPPGLTSIPDTPRVHQPTGIPYMEVEGRGKRPLRFCTSTQDGHTAGEQIVYQTLWNYARKFGRPEPSGSILVDVGLSQLCSLLGADHKNVKRLIGSLQEKLALEVVRPPDYRLAIPTRYRIFNYSQVLERRRAAGLQWVIRTRAVRFVELEIVNRLLAEQSLGELPTDGGGPGGDLPMGRRHAPSAGEPTPFPAELAAVCESHCSSTTEPFDRSGKHAAADLPTVQRKRCCGSAVVKSPCSDRARSTIRRRC